MNIPSEIQRASELGQKFEDMVVARKQVPAGLRERLVLGYWALIFDYHKGVMVLLKQDYPGGAFAMVRVIVEALLRTHLVIMGSDELVEKIRNDSFRMNLTADGSFVDEGFGMEKIFTNFLDNSRVTMHSFTHSGMAQITRRYQGNDLKQSYTEEEIIEVIRMTTAAVSMATMLTTAHFKFNDEWKRTNELFSQWTKQHPTSSGVLRG
jgi:hypothetical protein